MLGLSLLPALALAARLLWGAALPDRPLRLIGNLLLDAALVVLTVFIYRCTRDLLRLAPGQRRSSVVAAGTLDSRHLGTAALGASGFASGPLLAGAPATTVGLCALAGAVLLGLLGLKAVLRWQDPERGSWVGGVMFCGLAAVFFTVALLIRLLSR